VSGPSDGVAALASAEARRLFVNKHGRAPRAARKWAVVFSLLAASLAEGVAAAEEAPDGADDCVSFQNQLGNREISVHVENSCDIKLSCNLSYVVRCSSNDGSSSSRSAKQEAFKLARKGKHDLSLSAADCKQSWDIDQINWTCS
jgi:hypothetical protein